MNPNTLKRQFSTICILAGNKSLDKVGASIMKNIKYFSQEPVNFIGIAGDQMQSEGIQKTYSDINKFVDRPFLPVQNFHRIRTESIIHPLMGYYHWKNIQVLNDLEKQNFFKDIVANPPSAFVAVGSEYFMVRLYTKINEIFRLNDKLKPPMLYYDKLNIHQKYEFKEYLDHFLYTLPVDPINWRNYKFPGTHVGVQQVAKAYDYLYRSSNKYKNLANDKQIFIARDKNSTVIENLVNNARDVFRSNRQINETATLIFASLGDNQKDVKWAIPRINEAIKLFIDRFTKQSSITQRPIPVETFNVVIYCPPGSHKQKFFHNFFLELKELFDQTASKLSWACKYILVTTDDERYGAIAASDFGAVVNGDNVFECAALQLPITILDQEPGIKTYYLQLYNQFISDINIAYKGEIYPELRAQSFGAKIAEVLGEFYMNPKLKYRFIQRYEQLLLQSIPTAEGTDDVNAEQNAIVADNLNFSPYFIPGYKTADKIISTAQLYDSLNKNISGYKIPEVRAQLLTHLGWSYEQAVTPIYK